MNHDHGSWTIKNQRHVVLMISESTTLISFAPESLGYDAATGGRCSLPGAVLQPGEDFHQGEFLHHSYHSYSWHSVTNGHDEFCFQLRGRRAGSLRRQTTAELFTTDPPRNRVPYIKTHQPTQQPTYRAAHDGAVYDQLLNQTISNKHKSTTYGWPCMLALFIWCHMVAIITHGNYDECAIYGVQLMYGCHFLRAIWANQTFLPFVIPTTMQVFPCADPQRGSRDSFLLRIPLETMKTWLRT